MIHLGSKVALIAHEGNLQFFRMPGGKLFVLNSLFQGRKRHITSFLETETLMLVCLLFSRLVQPAVIWNMFARGCF